MKKYIALVLSVFCMTMNAQIDKNKQPKAGPAPTVNIKQPISFGLKNGLKVLLVENHKLPRVSFNLMLDNPPKAEGNKKGVSDLLSSMLGNGTSKMSKDQFNEELDFYGANVYFSDNGAYASTLSRYAPEVMQMVSTALLDPLLTQTEFQSQKDKIVESLKSEEKNVKSKSRQVQKALVFGKAHPFGEFVSLKTLENINLADVLTYYKENFVPNNAYLVIVGDITKEKAEKLVRSSFDSWQAKPLKQKVIDTPKNLKQVEIDFVNMPNAVQSEITVTNVTELKMNDKDYFAVLMANQILGGGGEGRLFLNLREAHGWTYGSYSSISGDKEVGRFVATASVRNAVTDSAIVEILNEIKRIRTTEVTAEELKNAKAKYIGNFVMGAEKPRSIANQALKTRTQSLSNDFYKNYIKSINAVTRAQVMAAAQKYFSHDQTRIVVVGKAEEVLRGLKTLNYPIHYYTPEAEPTQAPSLGTAIPAGVTAEKVVANYLQAIGGKTQAKQLTSLSMDFVLTGAAPQPLTGGIKYLAPNLERTEITMNGMQVMKTIFDGTTEKTSGMMGNAEKKGEDVAEKAAKKGLIEQAYYTKDQLELVSLSELDGKQVYKVKVTKGGKTSTEVYDAKTGLLLQQLSTVKTPKGEMVVTVHYKDYKKVGDLLFPMQMLQEVGPQKMEFTFKNIKVDEGVTAKDFE